MMARWRAGGCSCRPWLALVERAAQWLLLTHLRLTMKNGATSYLACTVALNDEVLMQDGQVNRVKADFSGKGRSTRYAS